MDGDAAERAHCSVLYDLGFAEDGADLFAPEAEAAVLFEGGHVAEDRAFVFEEGAAPFDGFFDVGAGLVDEFAKVLEDRLREGLRLVDVGVDFGVEVVEFIRALRLAQRCGGHRLRSCSRQQFTFGACGISEIFAECVEGG